MSAYKDSFMLLNCIIYVLRESCLKYKKHIPSMLCTHINLIPFKFNLPNTLLVCSYYIYPRQFKMKSLFLFKVYSLIGSMLLLNNYDVASTFC